MDNTYSTNSTPSTPYIPSSSPEFSLTTMFSQTTWTTWVIVILVLAFLGFNIFIYLAKGTQVFSNFFGPIISNLSGLFGNTAADATKQIVNVSATGTKVGVDVVAGTVTTGINTTQEVASSTPVQIQDNALTDALNQASTQVQDDESYHADEASSSIQASKSSSKSGWCYIGEDRGFRSCIQVGASDKCMSGSIFPTQEICVNPNLRQ